MTAKCISLDFYHTLMDGCDFLFVLGILAQLYLMRSSLVDSRETVTV